MKRSRREFLGSAAVAAAVSGFSQSGISRERSQWPPRLLYNNDGVDNPKSPATADSFLACRTAALADSEVDVVTYCTGIFHKYHHRSGLTDSHDFAGPIEDAIHGKSFQWVRDLHQSGTDPLLLVSDFARRNGRECWWSMRMNDTHDSRAHVNRPQARNPWKERNPHLLMRPAPELLPYGWFLARSWNWSAVDYNHQEVRELVVSIIDDVLSNYDVDGIELDFTRHSIFFREQTEGVPIADSQRKVLTDMMATIDHVLKTHEKRKGRQIRLAVHVPDSVDYCHAIGLDLIEWMKRKIPDLVVAGSDFQLQPWSHIVAACREHETPVAASFSALSITFDPEVWREEALQAWEAGVDGIATFNFFHPDHQLLRQLHDPGLLKRLPRKARYSLSPLNQKMIGSLATLLKDGEDYFDDKIRQKWTNPPPGL